MNKLVHDLVRATYEQGQLSYHFDDRFLSLSTCAIYISEFGLQAQVFLCTFQSGSGRGSLILSHFPGKSFL
jgi:hypothetical protein